MKSFLFKIRDMKNLSMILSIPLNPRMQHIANAETRCLQTQTHCFSFVTLSTMMHSIFDRNQLEIYGNNF